MAVKQRRYLADSTVVIDHLNGIEAATKFLREHATEIAISVITRAEVLSGVEADRAADVRRLLDQFPNLGITREIADQAARFRREQRWKLPDAFQAAVARRNKLALATRNTRDFPPQRHAFVKVPYEID